MRQRITPKFLSENVGQKMNQPQSYSFHLIYSRVDTKITQSYSFRSIYPRVRTKITPKQFIFIILNPTQRTSKSAPKFLPESQDENVCQPLCISSQGH